MTKPISRWRLIDGIFLLVVALIIFSGPLCLGSFRNTGRFLSGHKLLFDDVVNAGVRNRNGQVEATVRVVNGGAKSITILGGQSDCTVMPVKDLPITLAPLHAVDLRVELRGVPKQSITSKTPTAKETVRFFTDCKDEPHFDVEFVSTAPTKP